jgi:hypothetical protein
MPSDVKCRLAVWTTGDDLAKVVDLVLVQEAGDLSP